MVPAATAAKIIIWYAGKIGVIQMITASVVLYNTPYLVFWELLQSYKPDADRKLYIIDNSNMETAYCKEIENETIQYCFNGKNLGYGAAHNIGIRQALAEHSEYHLVLNPDIKFDSSIIDVLKNYADRHKDVVYMLPKVLYPNGEIQYLCKLLPTPLDLIGRRFLPKKLTQRRNDRYILKSSGYDKIINPPCLSGCFMFMRTSVLKEKRLEFDERFFLYCEDFDLMRRLHAVGKTIYYPKVQIVHNHEQDSYKNWKMLFTHMKSACIYFNKYGWFVDKERRDMNRRILEELGDGTGNPVEAES